MSQDVQSMTGFGRYTAEKDQKKITVEMKSVNHRYLDLSVKMSKRFNAFEADIRNYMKDSISRGKVDIFVNYEDRVAAAGSVTYNRDVAARYMEIYRKMAEDFSLEPDVTLSILASCPEVITTQTADEPEEELGELLMEALKGACAVFVEQRAAEGGRLRDDLLGKLRDIAGYVDEIVERSPQVIEEYRTGLTEKIRAVVADRNIDDSRVLTEAAVFADKICVDEEMVRMKSHITAMEQALKKGGPIGRNLDFIAQEMNREVNTTLSKSSDIALSECAVKLKTEVEKVREQIQNIE